jgi:hypothetical protein
MRAILASAVLLGAAVVGFGSTGACNRCASGTHCVPTAGVFAHVPLPIDELGGVTIAFCRNGACSTGTIPAASVTFEAGVDAWPYVGALLQGATLEGAFSTDVQLFYLGGGFTRVDLAYPTGLKSSTPLVDGDAYSLEVDDANGVPLLTVRRSFIYTRRRDACESCADAAMDLYPSSASDVRCTAKPCYAQVRISGTGLAGPRASELDLRVCKNGGDCATGTASYSASAAPGTFGGFTSPGFALHASYTMQADGAFAYDILLDGEPAAMKTGDVYSVLISSGADVLADAQATATYEESFPNGPRCDAVSCRSATITLP